MVVMMVMMMVMVMMMMTNMMVYGGLLFEITGVPPEGWAPLRTSPFWGSLGEPACSLVGRRVPHHTRTAATPLLLLMMMMVVMGSAPTAKKTVQWTVVFAVQGLHLEEGLARCWKK